MGISYEADSQHLWLLVSIADCVPSSRLIVLDYTLPTDWWIFWTDVSCLYDSSVYHGGDYERHCFLGRDVVHSFGNNVFSSENILKIKTLDSFEKLANFSETSELHNM